MPGATHAHAVSLFDQRPFFERALSYGVQHGLISAERLAAINQDAPKGMVQIARYFGTEFLRPELEAARERMVSLISLYLEHSCDGDLYRAAQQLQEHSLLSRSKGGSDMLKALIAMPQSTHFGLQSRAGFTDADKPLLAKWCQRPLADYRTELALRTAMAHKVEAARWWANQLELDDDDLEDTDAEALIRTGLLMQALRCKEAPDWPTFEAWIQHLRKQYPAADGAEAALPTLAVPAQLPAPLRGVVEILCESVRSDLRELLDKRRPIRKLLCDTPAFAGRYFWLQDPLAEVDHHARTASATWSKATGGHDDEASLLTLFLCLAAGSPPKTVLTQAAATRLARQLRKTGWQPQAAESFIRDHAPAAHRAAYSDLWTSFVAESEATLLDDHAHTLPDAQALLRRECNVHV